MKKEMYDIFNDINKDRSTVKSESKVEEIQSMTPSQR
jgi:hypothetical protein